MIQKIEITAENGILHPVNAVGVSTIPLDHGQQYSVTWSGYWQDHLKDGSIRLVGAWEALLPINGVDKVLAKRLHAAGFTSIDEVATAEQNDLVSIRGIGVHSVDEITNSARLLTGYIPEEALTVPEPSVSAED